MAVWLELRCDNRNSLLVPGADGNGRQRCLSHDNSGPMEMASNDATSITSARRDIFSQAKQTGWKKRGDDWLCSFCSKLPRVRL